MRLGISQIGYSATEEALETPRAFVPVTMVPPLSPGSAQIVTEKLSVHDAREIRALGYETTDVQTSRVTFAGGPEAGVRANLWLRTAGRVRLCVGAFEARDFDQLFDGVRQIRWEDYLPRDAAFPVRGFA